MRPSARVISQANEWIGYAKKAKELRDQADRLAEEVANDEPDNFTRFEEIASLYHESAVAEMTAAEKMKDIKEKNVTPGDAEDRYRGYMKCAASTHMISAKYYLLMGNNEKAIEQYRMGGIYSVGYICPKWLSHCVIARYLGLKDCHQ